MNGPNITTLSTHMPCAEYQTVCEELGVELLRIAIRVSMFVCEEESVFDADIVVVSSKEMYGVADVEWPFSVEDGFCAGDGTGEGASNASLYCGFLLFVSVHQVVF
eukprot:88971_1